MTNSPFSSGRFVSGITGPLPAWLLSRKPSVSIRNAAFAPISAEHLITVPAVNNLPIKPTEHPRNIKRHLRRLPSFTVPHPKAERVALLALPLRPTDDPVQVRSTVDGDQAQYPVIGAARCRQKCKGNGEGKRSLLSCAHVCAPSFIKLGMGRRGMRWDHP